MIVGAAFGYTLTHVRLEFAAPDGALPPEVGNLVLEAFGELPVAG